MKPGQSRPPFEIDLIAHADNRLLVVEAKSSPGFGDARTRARSLGKLLDAVDLLGADSLVLASSSPAGWSATDIDAARREVGLRRLRRRITIEALPLATNSRT